QVFARPAARREAAAGQAGAAELTVLDGAPGAPQLLDADDVHDCRPGFVMRSWRRAIASRTTSVGSCARAALASCTCRSRLTHSSRSASTCGPDADICSSCSTSAPGSGWLITAPKARREGSGSHAERTVLA